jgi:hypothetical protein
VRVLIAVTAALAALVLSPRPATELSKADAFGLELTACAQAGSKGKPEKCKLFGKIKYVQHFPDVKIQIVEHFPDIKVHVVEHFPDGPGKWQMVEHFPDYEVQIVEHFPDYKVKFVEHFPSCD